MGNDTWMKDNRAKLGSKTLDSLVLPGTHDSGTYAYAGMPAPPASVIAGIAGLLGLAGAWATWSAMLGFTITQERSISQQLEDGIRYLDIRVQADKGKQYIVHGFMPHCPKVIFGSGSGDAKGVLEDVRDFLSSRPYELVLLDFQQFQDMGSSDYQALFQQVKSTLGDMLVGPALGGGKTTSKTLDTIWGSSPSKGQVIALFDTSDWDKMKNSGWDGSVFWQRGSWIGSPWANTNKTSELRNFLYFENPKALRKQHWLPVLQGQLTTITSGDLTTLKSAAAKSNPKLMGWIADGTLGKQWSVIIVDYYDKIAAGYVSTVIGLNLEGWPSWTGNSQSFWAGNITIKQLSELNKQTGMEPETDEGPAAALLNGQLHVFYKGVDTNRMFKLTYDGTFWTGNDEVTAIGEPIGQPPGVTTIEQGGVNKLLLVYKVTGHDTLRSIRYDGNSWSSVSKPGMKSEHSPALVAYTDRNGEAKVMAVYVDNDSSDLEFAIYSVDDDEWSDLGKIEKHSKISPASQSAPAAAVYDGKIHVIYRGASFDTLYHAEFDLSSEIWSGNKKISDEPGGKDPASDASPAAVNSGGRLRLVYRGSNLRDLYQASWDGKQWHGNERIGDTDDSEITPDSNKMPALAADGDMLWLVFKGSHSNNLYVAGRNHFHDWNT